MFQERGPRVVFCRVCELLVTWLVHFTSAPVPVDYDETSEVSLARIVPSASEPLTSQTCASSSRAMAISHGAV
ncbi:hypothetical protein C3481_04175 [Microbacterium sp. Ru50]|nr:hypothetical protein C3481_04175 [Microbacterium sp. Ru50]